MAGHLMGTALFLVLLAGGFALVRQVWRSYARTVPNPSQIALDLFSSCLLGLGIVLSLAAPAFWWWMNGSHERYIWIISGPPPYDSFGSGPLQLWVGVLLVAGGLCLFMVGALARRHLKR